MFKNRRRKYKEEKKKEKQQVNEETKKDNEDFEKMNEKDKNDEKDKENDKNLEKNNEKDKGEENMEKDKPNEKDKEKEKNNEKDKDDKVNNKNQTASLSNKRPVKRYKYRFYSKNKNEEEIKKNDNINNDIEQSSTINNALSNNDNQIIKTSKKELILEKLKEIVPIIEDEEGEENITPNKPKKNNGIDIDGTSLIKNMFENEFQNESEDSTNAQLNSNAIKSEPKNSKKFYDNELIDAILDVEKYNVNNYLSKDLADIYYEINKDNVFFKNNVFLVNIDNFERKTGNLDKLKNKKFYNNDEDLNVRLKENHKTNEIINKFTEKSKNIK